MKGGVVIFRNDSRDKDMWVASNFHPYHNAYPEISEDSCSGTTFDQCTSVGPGEIWMFAFNKTGTWNYHEENKPVVTAKVRVLTTENYDKEF